MFKIKFKQTYIIVIHLNWCKGKHNRSLEFSIDVRVRGLSVPPHKQQGKQVSLTTSEKRNIIAFESGTDIQRPCGNRKRKAKHNNEERFRKRVEAKIQEGDISEAVRLLASDKAVAVLNSETLEILKLKHPDERIEPNYPRPPVERHNFTGITSEEVLKAV